MKFSHAFVCLLAGAAGILLVIALELGFGIRWSMEAYRLPDADWKPIRPVARFAFTGIVVTFTLIFGGAFLVATSRKG